MGLNTPTSKSNKSATFNMTPIVSAGIQAGSGLIDNLFNIGQKKKQRQHELDLAKYSYDQQREMIREQNIYNSPKSQMERFKEGGLNPHLIYGQGTPGNQSQIAKFNPPSQEYGELSMSPAIGSSLQNYNQIRLGQAQTNNLKAQTLTQGQIAKNEVYRGIGILADNKKKGIEMPYHSKKFQAQINQMDANVNSINAGTGLTEEKTRTQIQSTIIEKAKARLAKQDIFPGDNNYKVELKKAMNWLKNNLMPQGLNTKFPKYKW